MKKITLLMAALLWSSFFYGQHLNEGFEGSFLPAGWLDVAGANDVGNHMWAATTQRAYTGTKSAWFNDFFVGQEGPGGDNKHKFLISPVMDLSSATSPEFTYYESAKEPAIPATNNVYYTLNYTGDPSTTTWVLLSAGVGTEAWGKKGPYALPSGAGSETVRVAFEYEALFASEWFIDNVLVQDAPTCPAPSAASFTSVGSTSATFDWTPSGSETMWDVELVDITGGGSATGTPTETGVSRPHTFSSLTPMNEYDAYVRADCGGGDTSIWFGPIRFSTVPDDCANAQAVTHETGIATIDDATPVAGSIIGATGSGVAIPSCGGSATDDEDLWYSFVAATGTATVSVITGDFDAVVAVYSGTCGSLVEIGCADGEVENATETVDLTGLTNGETYFIRIFEWYSVPPGSNDITLKVWTSNLLSEPELDKDIAEFRFYPNPVQDKLNLRAQDNIENVSVYNMLGQEVMRQAPNSNNTEVNMSGLQTGSYFVKVTINGISETKQIIKR